VCCSVLQCVSVCFSALQRAANVFQCVAVRHCTCESDQSVCVLQCGVAWCSVLQVCCKCVAECRSVLQCVAVRCSVLQWDTVPVTLSRHLIFQKRRRDTIHSTPPIRLVRMRFPTNRMRTIFSKVISPLNFTTQDFATQDFTTQDFTTQDDYRADFWECYLVAVCCSVLQCVAICCSVLQCVAVCCGETLYLCLVRMRVTTESVGGCVGQVCCSVVQCGAVCCSVLQCIAVCCSVLQCVAVCCSALQCIAVCCSVKYVVGCSSVLQCDAECQCCVGSLIFLYEDSPFKY